MMDVYISSENGLHSHLADQMAVIVAERMRYL